MSKTNPARGMRDFLPDQVRKRDYVIGIIKEVYEKYGFEPLETPAVENLETLTNKYGEEGDQLMFKILKRGEKLRQELSAGTILDENNLADLALRYDLTVPLARVVANYKNELPKFFKRYQIQPVWRADRPARGRFREFYQCDADAIGSKSMVVEAELISAVSEIFTLLDFKDFEFRLNHRELLFALLRSSGITNETRAGALIALDKIDKIGESGFKRDLAALGIPNEATNKLMNAMEFFIKDSTNVLTASQKLKLIEILKLNQKLDAQTETAIRNATSVSIDACGDSRIEKGIDLPKNLARNIILFLELYSIFKNSNEGTSATLDLDKLWRLLVETGIGSRIRIDPTLARGLSYYTGAIFEVVLTKGDFSGSIAGGGRYDGLIGMFGKEEIPAVGISLGLERILMIMEERGMFPQDLPANAADVLVTVWSEDTIPQSLKLAGELRAKGLRVLVYPEAEKLGKQFKYADQINVRYVCVLGETEIAENTVTLKDLKSGVQDKVSRGGLFARIK